MQRFIKPEIKVISVRMDENIATSSSFGKCSLGREYSWSKQECQKCKLYFNVKGSLPDSTAIKSTGMVTFCNTYNLGYSTKEDAENAANSMNCPEGRG